MPFIIVKRDVVGGSIEEERTEIANATIRVGRGAGNEIQLDDPTVAIQHAVIVQAGPVLTLRDLGTASGTYVQGRQISERQLAHNDEIQIGPYTLRVSIPTPEAPVTLVVEPTALETAAAAAPAAPTPTARPAVELPPDLRPISSYYQLGTGRFTKGRLTVLGMIILVGGMVVAFALGATDQGKRANVVWAPGKVAGVHSLFEAECERCHQQAWHINVADKTCETCHSGPIHHDNQTFTPRCTSCHTEHQGRQAQLALMKDTFCTQCHVDLHISDGGTPQYDTAIQSFTSGHPEFAVAVQSPGSTAMTRVRLDDPANLRDTAQMQLNHDIHLKPEKMGPKGFEQLQCRDCHQPDAQGAYMMPITFEPHCQRCHPLELPAGFAPGVQEKVTVPHEEPSIVRGYLESAFIRHCLQSLAQGPAEQPAEEAIDDRRRRFGAERLVTREEAGSIEACQADAVQGAEQFFFVGPKRQGCVLCHTITPAEANEAFPKVVPPAMPQRWLPHSVFNHQAHSRAERKCEDCHQDVRASTQTTDVLLPSLASCQACHSAAGGARSACVTCHVYHDKAKTRELEATLTGQGQTPR